MRRQSQVAFCDLEATLCPVSCLISEALLYKPLHIYLNCLFFQFSFLISDISNSRTLFTKPGERVWTGTLPALISMRMMCGIVDGCCLDSGNQGIWRKRGTLGLEDACWSPNEPKQGSSHLKILPVSIIPRKNGCWGQEHGVDTVDGTGGLGSKTLSLC